MRVVRAMCGTVKDHRYLIGWLALMTSMTVKAFELPPLDCVIEPNEVVEVSSPVEGVIDTLMVERNAVVQQGQVLATLESTVEAAQVELALSLIHI